MDIAVGIDLGTTNSCVSVMTSRGPEVLVNKAGYKTTPSIVAITDGGRRLVGQLAKRQAITNPEHTVFAAKRLIGRRWNSPVVDEARKRLPYKLVAGPQDDVRIELRGKAYSIPEISSMILQELKILAEQNLKASVTRAVITVPAYFNDSQRKATVDAGKIAGLEVLRIINEPTAAALAFGYGKSANTKVAVYDLGGGTFDISILDIQGDKFKVIATSGDTYLGGEDFDQQIIDWMLTSFRAQNNIDLSKNAMAMQRLKDAAENAKHDLSERPATEINLPYITTLRNDEAVHLVMRLERPQFETMVRSYIDRSLQIVDQALSLAKLVPTDIQDVIMVGGQTRMPLIRQLVGEYFGRAPSHRVHPDEAVAMGAAIQAAALTGGAANMSLMDVTPQDLGIMVAGGYAKVLIPANTTVPVRQSMPFTTVKDNQAQVKIVVLQGSSKHAEDNEMLGEFTLTGLRQAPRGAVQIDVAFDIGLDGIVKVSAMDRDTGLEATIEVTGTSGLTSEEIQDMIEENRDYLLEEKTSQEFENKRHVIEQLANEINTMIPRVQLQLGSDEFGADVIRRATELLQKAAAATGSRDLNGLIGLEDPLRRTLAMFKGMVKG